MCSQMDELKTVQLTRDCNTLRIPSGTPMLLREGSEVTVTQALGGTYTVQALGGLYRVDGADRDALGFTDDANAAESDAPAVEVGPLDETAVWDALKSCFDPEIPVNIVDLGLVYDLTVDQLESAPAKVGVKMTLTAQGCGMGEVIAGDAKQKIEALAGVDEATVEIVWDPPWHQSMITADGRRVLGL
jgi:probable FeS assembly SUF system protein SufT